MEQYIFAVRHRPFDSATSVVFFLVLLASWKIVSSTPNSYHHRITDQCDWFGSGVEEKKISGVQPVYLRCKEGSILWQYPRGALRIILRIGHSNKNFRACMKIATDSSGVNLYLEGPRKLQHLYRHNETQKSADKHICFQSVGGQVALFLEAHRTIDSLKKSIFKFMYDLEPIRQESFSECRPCSHRELLYLFCTSDFAVRGTISSLYENEVTQRTELRVKARQILRDSEPKVFQTLSKSDKNLTIYSGVLYRPLQCGTRAGTGEFLFLGRRKLGDPILTCAPRWIEWKKIRQKAFSSGNLDCMLE